ncbi:MAG: efflux RND transporter periplasmic adaptor subunit [Blastocatellia bacterium]
MSRKNLVLSPFFHHLFFLTLALLPVGCARATPGKDAAPKKPAAAAAKVKTAAIERRAEKRAVEASGSLFAFEEVTVSAEAEGRVEQVMFDIGDRVSKGQVLARISPVEMELSVEQQQAALRQARARLGLSEEASELRKVRDAAEVKKAAADLAEAEQRYKRAQSLLESGVIARQLFDEAESRYKSARAAHDLAVQQVENMRAGMQQTQATLHLAQKRLRDAHIRAPFSGHIRERAVTVGQYLKIQTPVMTIVNTDPLRARLEVPEKMAPWVRQGREVQLSVEAFPDRKFNARISRINPAVNEKTRTFEIEALVVNHNRELKPGSFVKAIIASDKVDDILTIPKNSASYLFGAWKVFVVQGKTLREREVKLGDNLGDRIEILEGLAGNERIALIENGQTLKDGQEIEIVE